MQSKIQRYPYTIEHLEGFKRHTRSPKVREFQENIVCMEFG